MSRSSRRSFLAALGANVLAAPSFLRASATASSSALSDLPTVGKIPPRTSLAIAASPLSIGFETLDRRMFDPQQTYPHLAELGVKWARCQTGWARTERTRGEYDFAWLDEVVDSLRKLGIQPWFNLGYGNRLYTPDAPHESAVGWAPLWSDEARQAWLAYVRKLAEHFGARVSHWELWNEPNIANFWQPKKPDAGDYVQLVRMTAPEIRKRVPNAVIIGGALAGVPRDYLERCLAAGMGALVDKVSYHPYRPIPESNYEKDVRGLREAIARHKPGIGLWQGENGCPSENGGSGALSNLDWNEARQAKWLLRRILSDLRLDLELTSYFHTVDLVDYVWSSGKTGKTNYKGVLRGKTYTRKPSYYAYQNLCALFDSETRRTDSTLRFAPAAGGPEGKPDEWQVSAIWAAAFARRGKALYAYWYPADLQQDFAPRRVTVEVRGNLALNTPVLADPLTGRIHKLERAARTGGAWVFPPLPLADYPLLLADQAALE